MWLQLLPLVQKEGFLSSQTLPCLTSSRGCIFDSEQLFSCVFYIFKTPSVVHHSGFMVNRTLGGELRKFLQIWCHFMLPPVLFLLSALNQQKGGWEKYDIFFYCIQGFKEWHIFFPLSDCSLPTLHEQTHKVAQQLPWCAGEHKDSGSCLEWRQRIVLGENLFMLSFRWRWHNDAQKKRKSLPAF